MLAAIVGLFVAGIGLEWLHPLRQWNSYHDFADTRAWLGVPNAADVLSNVPILLAGLALAAKVWRPHGPRAARTPGLVVAAIGLVLTGFGSAYYHLAPNDATLIWDRLPLATVFAGALLTAWACSGATSPTLADAALVVFAAFASVAYWVWTGSLWPYAILQFGALAALLFLALRNRLVPARAWWLLILFYALAKLFELLDHQVWALTQHAVSGHTLKHLMSAAAGFCFLWIADGQQAAAPGITHLSRA
jgi:hypothetical protein